MSEFINFSLTSEGRITQAFLSKNIHDFLSACHYVAGLPYGRNANRSDFLLVLSEEKGTCSSKHALLAELALENGVKGVELIAGIFLMSPETHAQLTDFFKDKPYSNLPECHCYLRFQGERYDFTTQGDVMQHIAPFIVREQRIDPNQVVDWKIVIHKDYLQRWLNRNLGIPLSLEEIWKQREEAIGLL